MDESQVHFAKLKKKEDYMFQDFIYVTLWKRKTIGLKIDQWLPRVKCGIGYKGSAQGKFEVNETILCGTGVANTWVYVFVKTHLTVHQKEWILLNANFKKSAQVLGRSQAGMQTVTNLCYRSLT